MGPPAPPPELTEWLGAALRDHLGVLPHDGEPLPPRRSWWVEGRLSSNEVVDALIRRYPPAGEETPRNWVLGVTAADLFVPDWHGLVLGEATLGGGWALVSTARLQDHDPSLLQNRLLKETVHELGHLLDLPDCPTRHCVMSVSSSVAEVDRKGLRFCGACERLRGGSRHP